MIQSEGQRLLSMEEAERDVYVNQTIQFGWDALQQTRV